MSKSPIDVQPIAGALGAEIGGVDLTNLDDETFTAIHDAFLQHLVIFFRDQYLSPEQPKALSRRFGEPYIHPYRAPGEGHPERVRIVTQPADTLNFCGRWNTDLTHLEKPTPRAHHPAPT